MCAVAVMMVGCGSDKLPDSPLSGSGTGTSREVIDLDKVLKIMADTIKDLEPKKTTDSSEPKTDAATDKPKAPPAQDKIKEKEFLAKFAENLNKEAVSAKPIGVTMLQNGTVQGFEDRNKNNIKDGSDEKELFKVQIDEKQKRFVASDPQGYHRDHGFGMGMGGFFMGYLMSSMLSRHHAAGLSPNRFDNTKMSQPGYHRTAATQARTAPKAGGTSGTPGSSGAARSRGGSGGFSRGGK